MSVNDDFVTTFKGFSLMFISFQNLKNVNLTYQGYIHHIPETVQSPATAECCEVLFLSWSYSWPVSVTSQIDEECCHCLSSGQIDGG